MAKRKAKKAIRHAYHKGRKEGFDHGFNTAKMIYTEIAASLKQEIEQLNTEIIMGSEEEEDEYGGER